MRKFSKKPVVWGARFCAPLLLLLVIIAVTSLARARPVGAAKKTEDFKAFSWKTRGKLAKHLSGDDEDSNDIAYKHYHFKINTNSSVMYVNGEGKIDLKERCVKGDNKTPYRWWFWVKGNKLRSSGVHWSTDSFIATTKPLTYSYNTNQYSKRGDNAPITRYEVKKKGGFVASLGNTVTDGGKRYGVTLYVIDLREWYNNRSYNKLADDYSGHVYLHTVASIYSAGGSRLSGPFKTLASWTAAARARGFDSSGVDDYKDHYNQVININNTITHKLKIYRMHTSTKYPVKGAITEKGEVKESCKFKTTKGKDISKIYDKNPQAGSIIKLVDGDSYDFSEYTCAGKTYYLKGIREVHIDSKTGKQKAYAKFWMLDDLTKDPIAGNTDRKTDKYTQVDKNDVSKVDSISSKDLSYYKKYTIKIKKNGTTGSAGDALKSPKEVRAGNKKGLTGKRTWKKIVNYMKSLTWKNGIQENRIYLIYQESPEKHIKVYNRMFQYSDKESKYQVVSGGTSPVYTQKIKSGDSKISIDLTKIQKESVSAKKPDKKGCAATYKTGGDGNYFAKNVKIKYVNKSGDEVEKTFSIGDYYYNSSNGNVGKAGSSFTETDTKKTYTYNTSHKDTEKALTAIVQHLYKQVSLTANTTDDVEIYVDYYQPKVPSVALIYRRSYDDNGKAVDTLVTTQKLGNFHINSTTAEKKCLGSYGEYSTTMSFTKDSDGKWTIAKNTSADEEGVETLSLVEEKVYKADVENYHGATSSSWSGNGLREETKYYVKEIGSTKHSLTYTTTYKGNAVKLVYGEKQASYTYNVYYTKEINGVREPWELGKTVTKFVNTAPESEDKRTRQLTYNETLEGMGVTTVTQPEKYELDDSLTTIGENQSIVKLKERLKVVLTWPQKSTDSIRQKYVSTTNSFALRYFFLDFNPVSKLVDTALEDEDENRVFFTLSFSNANINNRK